MLTKLVCQDIIKKPKLDQHRSRCHGAYFTCIDCNTTFERTDYRNHTSCMTEAQRYQKGLYRPTKKELKKAKMNGNAVNSKELSPNTDNQNTPAGPTKHSLDENEKDKENKKSKKETVSSPAERLLALTQNQEISLYKLLKKYNKQASKEDSLDSKEVLKHLAITADAKGNYLVKPITK